MTGSYKKQTTGKVINNKCAYFFHSHCCVIALFCVFVKLHCHLQIAIMLKLCLVNLVSCFSSLLLSQLLLFNQHSQLDRGEYKHCLCGIAILHTKTVQQQIPDVSSRTICLIIVLYLKISRSIFLPNPHDGSLYAFGSMSDGLKVSFQLVRLRLLFIFIVL